MGAPRFPVSLTLRDHEQQTQRALIVAGYGRTWVYEKPGAATLALVRALHLGKGFASENLFHDQFIRILGETTDGRTKSRAGERTVSKARETFLEWAGRTAIPEGKKEQELRAALRDALEIVGGVCVWGGETIKIEGKLHQPHCPIAPQPEVNPNGESQLPTKKVQNGESEGHLSAPQGDRNGPLDTKVADESSVAEPTTDRVDATIIEVMSVERIPGGFVYRGRGLFSEGGVMNVPRCFNPASRRDWTLCFSPYGDLSLALPDGQWPRDTQKDLVRVVSHGKIYFFLRTHEVADRHEIVSVVEATLNEYRY